MNYKLNLMDSFYAESNQLKKWQRVLFYVLSLLAACFLYTVLLGVANYTFDFTPDEPLYLLICERLLRGDRTLRPILRHGNGDGPRLSLGCRLRLGRSLGLSLLRLGHLLLTLLCMVHLDKKIPCQHRAKQ